MRTDEFDLGLTGQRNTVLDSCQKKKKRSNFLKYLRNYSSILKSIYKMDTAADLFLLIELSFFSSPSFPKVKKGIAVHAFLRNSEGALLAPVALLAFQEPLASLEGKENLVIKDHMVFLATLEQK